MAAVPSRGRASAVEPRPATPEAEVTRDLYERYHRQIFSYCLHQLSSREEAEDATQTTFMNAFRGLRRGVVPELESAWLFKIANNVILTRRRSTYRRRRIETPGDLDAIQDLLPSPQRDADELIRLTEALGGMPDQQRKALLLREWQGLSYREIGDRLGLSQAAVETLLFRARRSLAAGLTEAPQTKNEPKRKRGRLRGGLDVGSALAGIKGLLAGGAAVKVAATAAVVVTTAVVAEPPVRQHFKPEPPAPKVTQVVAPVAEPDRPHVSPGALEAAPATLQDVVWRKPRAPEATRAGARVPRVDAASGFVPAVAAAPALTPAPVAAPAEQLPPEIVQPAPAPSTSPAPDAQAAPAPPAPPAPPVLVRAPQQPPVLPSTTAAQPPADSGKDHGRTGGSDRSRPADAASAPIAATPEPLRADPSFDLRRVANGDGNGKDKAKGDDRGGRGWKGDLQQQQPPGAAIPPAVATPPVVAAPPEGQLQLPPPIDQAPAVAVVQPMPVAPVEMTTTETLAVSPAAATAARGHQGDNGNGDKGLKRDR